MLRRLMMVPTLAAALVLSACDNAPTGSQAVTADDDYALLMFGEPGSSLEGTMGTQHRDRPFDGRSGGPRLPDELRLTAEQRAEMEALRTAFRTEHAVELDAMKAIFEEARAARLAGATREEVRAILIEARPIGLTIREDVWALHLAIRAVLTPEQLAWIAAHRPQLPRGPILGGTR